MSESAIIDEVLKSYGLQSTDFVISRLGSGHIHGTFLLKGSVSYVLQRVNKNVFREPEAIATNLVMAGDYLRRKFPAYPFLKIIPASENRQMVYDPEGFPWRLFHFQEGTITIDHVETVNEAYSAASEFARLTACLDGIDVSGFRETIHGFHDLDQRYRQFESALAGARTEIKVKAIDQINECVRFRHLVGKYIDLIAKKSLRLRITHNDTKINNILFDQTSRQAVCVIDLDTLMPGFFIYDLGDMVRTFVSPVSEEEQDYSKIEFRPEIYKALLDGYLSQMDSVLTADERKAIPFAGKMMTFIMALRFLADYLQGDKYYHTSYEGQNLVRAGNQLNYLRKLEIALPE